MVPTPIALGLTLCEKVIVEEATRNITLVNCFSRLRAAAFPFQPVPFSVCAALTDAHGAGTIHVTVTRLETDEVIHDWQAPATFPDRFAVVRVRFRINDCSFPAPGRYQIMLSVNGE
jgi:hypothetical protein